jgi:glycerol kinase
VRSKNRLLTTIAYRLDGKTTYALEGSIFIAGAAVQWLRDGAKMISKAADSGELAAKADDTQNVYLVPAFVGLGAPHWDAEARGAIFGLTRNSGPAEFARAALESVAYQTRDLLDAMKKDWKGGRAKTVLRVDGGMVASDWTMQRLADVLDAPVDRPTILETTALGAAWLAGSRAGVWPKAKDFAKSWALDRRFKPAMKEALRAAKLKGWRDAVRRTLSENWYIRPARHRAGFCAVPGAAVLGAAHHAADDQHDVADRHHPDRGDRDEGDDAERHQYADDDNNERNPEEQLGRCTEIHLVPPRVAAFRMQNR